MPRTDIEREIARRALLELLTELGGDQNDQVLTETLQRIGHRVTRRQVVADIAFLADAELLNAVETPIFTVADVTAHGRDIAEGRGTVRGIYRHRVNS